jgi:CDP-diacylglycerol--glycerol-3-phosphate 3-phosphatidyltransferase
MSFQKYSDNLIEATILRFIPKWITPNQVSWLRIMSIPFVFYLLTKESYLYGFILFSISALTDAIDGAMARKRNQITEFGIVLDPTADKMLIGVVALIFIPKYFGWNILIAIILLEILSIFMANRSKKILGRNPGANWYGKTKMIIQCVAFIFVFIGIFSNYIFYFKTAEIFLYISLLFTILQIFTFPKK